MTASSIQHIFGVFGLCLGLLLSPVRAEIPTALDWSQLVDASAQDFEDPYAALTPDQLYDLISLVRTRQRLEDAGMTGEQRNRASAKATELEGRLHADKIDIDWLISQRWVVAEKREQAAVSANPAVDGRTVSLAGFAIPAPPDADGFSTIYLVPERGMCSHIPPPNPNQMIRARLTSDWRPTFMHQPVMLTGVLSISESNRTVIVVDGPVPMRAAFDMVVSKAEPLTLRPPTTSELPFQAQGLTERLRATGKRPNRPSSASN